MKRQGFSLVEIVFSFCLLTVVLMLVFNLFPTSAVAVEKARLETRACAIAQSRLEAARLRPFTDLKVGSLEKDSLEDGGDHFEISQSVRAVPGESQDRLVSVRVSVDWEYRTQRRQSVQETYVFRLQR